MSQVVVVNITPHLTHLGTLCFLRGIFRRVVATKPVSCFKYRSSCYVTCFGFSPDRAAPDDTAGGEPEAEPAAAAAAGGGGAESGLGEPLDAKSAVGTRVYCPLPSAPTPLSFFL